ncbi:hypothetical protein ATCV1_Z625L [Acanthocystis turfacea chlorella virus 1]|uniref:Uncharacterized protein Z625L n=1 Tax=Chlorovirus heliozoae TaxID=322019 RepID=A7K9N5_9PHYC|nr:hypothetical protein ATCV1_Z625L [Acanthocystis turfacea chlorella virus 1]ABT16759.1 hypothetical protein ATCV1_Z625L [Acanthocystis turfacea chlorella virus 1]
MPAPKPAAMPAPPMDILPPAAFLPPAGFLEGFLAAFLAGFLAGFLAILKFSAVPQSHFLFTKIRTKTTTRVTARKIQCSFMIFATDTISLCTFT